MSTPSAIRSQKQALRVRVRALLAARSLNEGARASHASATACGHLRRWISQRLIEAPHAPVALFASMPNEIDTHALDDSLRADGVARALPRVTPAGLVFHLLPHDVNAQVLPRDRHGIPTPDEAWPTVSLASCAAVVVPGLAVDAAGRRLGHGRGYYDRVLGEVAQERVCLLVFACQRVPLVPAEGHDIGVARSCDEDGFVVHERVEGLPVVRKSL